MILYVLFILIGIAIYYAIVIVIELRKKPLQIQGDVDQTTEWEVGDQKLVSISDVSFVPRSPITQDEAKHILEDAIEKGASMFSAFFENPQEVLSRLGKDEQESSMYLPLSELQKSSIGLFSPNALAILEFSTSK